MPVQGLEPSYFVSQEQWYRVLTYRKGRDCRIGLVILDTPVSALLMLQSCSSPTTKKPAVTPAILVK